MYHRLILSGVIALFSLLPLASQAASITLNGVSPELDEDITPADNQKAGEENFYTFWFKGQIGTEYTVNFNVSEEPAFTFVSGGDMTLDSNIHFNSVTNVFSVTYTAVPLQQIDSQSSLELGDNQTLTIVAVSFPVAEGESGPGESTKGSWLASNFQEWTLTTPSESNNVMGATVQGDAGDAGDFELFMPAVTLNAMAEYDGQTDYNAEDMALYKDGEETNAIMEEITGGAYINFSTILPESSEDSVRNSSSKNIHVFSQSVSQQLLVAPVPSITLTSTKNTVKKLSFVTLSGAIKSGLNGERVTLWRRTKDSKLKKFATVVTKKNGTFEFRVKIREMVLFKAKYNSSFSDGVYVQVK